MQLIGTRKDVGLVQLLVESSANMNVQNNESRTPLEEALVKGHLDVVQLLWNQATVTFALCAERNLCFGVHDVACENQPRRHASRSTDNWPLTVRQKHLSESDDVVECTPIQCEDAAR